MILRGLAFALLLVSVLLLQTIVAPVITVAGVPPDFLVLSVLAVGMCGGSGRGLRYGFVAGLAADLLAGPDSIIGVSALLLLLGGHAAGLARPFIAASEFPGQVLLGGVGVAVLQLLGVGFGVLLGEDAPALVPLVLDVLIAAAYAALLAPVLCFIVDRIQRALPDPA